MSQITVALDALDTLVKMCQVEGVIPKVDIGGGRTELVEVVDGGPLTNAEANMLFVGWAPDEATVDGDSRKMPGLGNRREETFDIAFFATTWNGDKVEAACRESMRSIYTAVGLLVEGNPTLDGTVQESTVGTRYLYAQGQGQTGAVASLLWTITCRAFTRQPS